MYTVVGVEGPPRGMKPRTSADRISVQGHRCFCQGRRACFPEDSGRGTREPGVSQNRHGTQKHISLP